MIIDANAKINMTLDVSGKRSDGYHEVSMIMQEISLADKIEINKKSSSGIELKVQNSDIPCDESNIAFKAAKLFLDKIKSDDGIEMIIQKNIPVCAGLGGGSADGAAVLKALNQMYDSPLSLSELLEMGVSLGADVPFCIVGKTCHAGGIGEILTPFKSELRAYVALIKPDVDISTPKAYKAIDQLSYTHPEVFKVKEALEKADKDLLVKYGANVFEYVCLNDHPEIDKIKTHFKNFGAFYTMMSGSGPTVFGLFDNKDDAQKSVDSYNRICQSKHVCRMII